MITVSELLEITFRMGLPVFTLAATVQFIFLSKKFSLKWFFSLLIVGVTFLIEGVTTIALWLSAGWLNIRLPQSLFMIFEIFNLFALIAALIVIPMVNVFVRRWGPK